MTSETAGSAGQDRVTTTAASFYRLDGSWSCTRDRVTAPCGDCDGCRSIAQENRTLVAELDRLRRVETHAKTVMALLDQYGPSIVGHLIDNDDNPGEYLRRALEVVPDYDEDGSWLPL